MAALQTLRNKPALLMSVIGGALLLFIITMVLENHNPFTPSDKAGEAFGEQIKINDLSKEVEEETNFQIVARTLQNMANGNMEMATLNEQEKEQLRHGVWQANVQHLAVVEETNKLGLSVTDEELTNYLQNVNLQNASEEVQVMIMAGYVFNGNPTIAGYQSFLKDFDKTIQQMAQTNSGMVEFAHNVRRACVYAESKLKKTLLQNKYMALMRGSFTSNPIAAKMLFDEAYTKYDFELATVAYDSIDAADIKVTDEDYKKLYEQYKEQFRTPSATREVKLIDFVVRATPADIQATFNKVKAAEDSLKNTNDITKIKAILASANTNLDFQNVYLTKKAYEEINLRNIIARADSMAVGAVCPTVNDGQNVYTLKLVGKKTTADSLQMAFIPAVSKAQADSIMADLKSGKSWAEVAKAKGAKDTLIWEYFPFYNDREQGDSGVYTHPAQLAMNTPGILQSGAGYVVVKVAAQKSMSEKFNIAIVRNEIDFTEATYEAALSKMNNLVASNKEAGKIEEAARKEGYDVMNVPGLSTASYSEMSLRYGDKAGEIMRWIFDEAEIGQVSSVFETHDIQGNTHLLSVAYLSECEDEYLPWDNKAVKDALHPIAIQEKKAAKALEMVKNVKDMSGMLNVKGVKVDNVSAKTIYELGNADPALMGAVQKVQKGQFLSNIKGANGVYAIRMIEKTAPTAPFTEDIYMNYATMQNFYSVFGQQGQYPAEFFNYLIERNGDVKDSRYKF